MLCYAKLKDKESFMQWLENTGWCRKSCYYSSLGAGGWYNDHWRDYFYQNQKIFNHAKNIFEDSVDDIRKIRTNEFFDLIDHISSINQKLMCYYLDDFACLVGYGKNNTYVMPSEWFEFEELKDYSSLKISELKALGTKSEGMELPSITEDVSKKDIESKISEEHKLLDSLEQRKKEIEEGKVKELSDIMKKYEEVMSELNRQKQDLLSKLHDEQEKLLKQMNEMQQQIFILDTQIYGIRCYLGEVIDFYTIKEGKDASVEEPIVLYQKIRYLDEEMGKYLSIYNFGDCDEDMNDLLEVLKYRDDIVNILAPAKRCVVVLKMSRTGKVIGASDKAANMLKKYDMYHGNQMAILIRNGDNLHIAWLDEDRITFSDENLYFEPYVSERPFEDKDNSVDKEKQLEEAKHAAVSRYFLFSIVQGLIDQKKFLKLPEKISVLKPDNHYLIYSLANGWLNDERYGTFEDIINRVKNLEYTEGDYVLTCTRITRDDIYERGSYGMARQYERYNNDRGIGDKNRTKDASLPSMKVIPINKVLYSMIVEISFEKIKVIPNTLREERNGRTYSETKMNMTDEIIGEDIMNINISQDTFHTLRSKGLISKKPSEEELINIVKYEFRYEFDNIFYDSEKEKGHCWYSGKLPDGAVFYKRRIKSVIVKNICPVYYLSAKKDSWYSDKEVSVNMQVYSDEFIPLTYLCADWIEYVITTGNIGRWGVAGTYPSYAQALPYFNKLFTYLKRRKEEEEKILKEAGGSKFINQNNDWNVKLTEWRIENKIRKFSPYQAKRFLKTV